MLTSKLTTTTTTTIIIKNNNNNRNIRIKLRNPTLYNVGCIKKFLHPYSRRIFPSLGKCHLCSLSSYMISFSKMSQLIVPT